MRDETAAGGLALDQDDDLIAVCAVHADPPRSPRAGEDAVGGVFAAFRVQIRALVGDAGKALAAHRGLRFGNRGALGHGIRQRLSRSVIDLGAEQTAGAQ